MLQLLAFGAEVATSVADHNPLNSSTANRAGSTEAVSDLEFIVGSALLTTRTLVGINAG